MSRNLIFYVLTVGIFGSLVWKRELMGAYPVPERMLRIPGLEWVNSASMAQHRS